MQNISSALIGKPITLTLVGGYEIAGTLEDVKPLLGELTVSGMHISWQHVMLWQVHE